MNTSTDSKSDVSEWFHQDIKKLLDDIQELKPTVLCAVPRVLDKIYTGKKNHVLKSWYRGSVTMI